MFAALFGLLGSGGGSVNVPILSFKVSFKSSMTLMTFSNISFHRRNCGLLNPCHPNELGDFAIRSTEFICKQNSAQSSIAGSA